MAPPGLGLPRLLPAHAEATCKHLAARRSRPEEFREFSKEVRKAVQTDWEAWLASTTDKDLDIRDKWLGIKFHWLTPHAADPCEIWANFGPNMGPRGSGSGLKRRGVSAKSILAGFGLKRSHGDLFLYQNRGVGIHW